MSETVISWPVWAAFVLASVALAVTPGPGVLYIVTRTMAQGRRAGIASVAGVVLGNLGNAMAASVGLAVVFALSPAAFTAVKLIGAAYLVYLGINLLRQWGKADEVASVHDLALGRIFRQGLVVALLNPKTAVFFAAFLPQFISPAGSAIVQSVVFGTVFVIIAACTDTAYVLAAGMAATAMGRVRNVGRFGRCATAAVFIGLGVFTAAG